MAKEKREEPLHPYMSLGRMAATAEGVDWMLTEAIMASLPGGLTRIGVMHMYAVGSILTVQMTLETKIKMFRELASLRLTDVKMRRLNKLLHYVERDVRKVRNERVHAIWGDVTPKGAELMLRLRTPEEVRSERSPLRDLGFISAKQLTEESNKAKEKAAKLLIFLKENDLILSSRMREESS